MYKQDFYYTKNRHGQIKWLLEGNKKRYQKWFLSKVVLNVKSPKMTLMLQTHPFVDNWLSWNGSEAFSNRHGEAEDFIMENCWILSNL